jgi:transcription antitermination protein NusB
MISRRNIRVKVMQTLYVIDNMGVTPKPGEPAKLLDKQFELSRQLLVYLVYCLTEVARYAETDSRNKASKHLPSAEDLNVNVKIAGNQLLWKILEQPSFQKALSADKPQLLADNGLIKKIYLELIDTPEYKQYAAEQSRTPKEEKQILEFIFTDLMLPNENFTGHLEEIFTNWDDDGEMMNQLILNFIGKPQSFNFQDILSKEKRDFAKDLLLAVLDRKDVTQSMITPKLKNWDAERIATLDMILMEMGVCEFLFFETIPPKVTINEYIDLAKSYSTPQSGQFVNGILDNIHKELVKDDKMHKVTFKKNQQ